MRPKLGCRSFFTPEVKVALMFLEMYTGLSSPKLMEQLNGNISFIEKLSFNTFNEGTRLIHCLKMYKRLFGGEAKKVGGDTGYAGTENRDYCKANWIQTSFVKRGRPFGEKKKEKDLVRKELARVRVTAMEGSFGTQKERYDLRRVKAGRSGRKSFTSSSASIRQTWCS